MSSAKKGDKLEKQIFNLLKEEISRDRFFIKKDNCRIYSKKGYFSKDRGKNIIFDISIEAFLPGQKTYSLLILVECKNYDHPVPVDDAEEFYQKIQQISGGNVKGIIASTSSFQEGTFNFSKSKGLALVRYYEQSKLSWELTRSPSSLVSSTFATRVWQIAHDGLTIPSFKSDYFDFYCYTNNQYTNSLNLFFSFVAKSDLNDEFNKQLSSIENRSNSYSRTVDYKKKTKIELVSNAILRKIKYTSGSVPIDMICTMLEKKEGLRVLNNNEKSSDIFGKPVLGKIKFNPLEITIFKEDNENSERRKFTLAHELGHYFLGHSEYMTGELCKEDDIDLEKPVEIGIKDIMIMEWQANYFASSLLLPRSTFVRDVLIMTEHQELPNRGFGILYLDHQKCNQAIYYNITDTLKNKYKVSRSVIKLRLKNLGLLQGPYF